jgi:PAS domain-containing protein
MVRALTLVGMVLAASLSLSHLLWPVADVEAMRMASGACALLAAVYAVLALFPRLLTLAQTVIVAVLGTCAVAGVLASVGGDGLLSPGLAFVPLLLCAAASQIRPAATLALGLVHAALLAGVAVAVLRGAIVAQHEVTGLGPALATQAALLAAGLVIGLLTRRSINSAIARARSREQRFVGLLSVAADWYWEKNEAGEFTRGYGPVLEMLGHRNAEAGAVWDTAGCQALQEKVATRQPFLDFVVHRLRADGSRQQFRVSGEPMFNSKSRFVGYRGIGVELTAKS